MRDLNTSQFQEAIQSETTQVIDFWADWCMPCKLIAPVMLELETELGDRAEFCKLNVDDNPSIAAEYGVASIPTLICFNKGEEVGRVIGLKQKAQLKAEIEACL